MRLPTKDELMEMSNNEFRAAVYEVLRGLVGSSPYAVAFLAPNIKKERSQGRMDSESVTADDLSNVAGAREDDDES